MLRKITLSSLILALIVVAIGATIHLTDTGRGCPDWPGCYGQALIFDAQPDLDTPDLRFDMFRAWTELAHRYLTAVLAVLALMLLVSAGNAKQHRIAATGVLSLAVAQLVLGAVAIKTEAEPVYVAGLMLSEIATFWLLFGLYLRSAAGVKRVAEQWQGLRGLVRASQGVLLLFIAVMVWYCADQANDALRGYPGYWHEWRFITETGVISFDNKTAVQWLVGAAELLSFIMLLIQTIAATRSRYSAPVRASGWSLGLALLVYLGLTTTAYQLDRPLYLSTIEALYAALMMLPLITMRFYARYGAEFEPAGVKVAERPDEVEPPYAEPAPESLYLRLKSQLHRTRSGLGELLAGLSLAQKDSGEDVLEDLEASLLMADIGITVTTEIINRMTQQLTSPQLKDTELLTGALKQELLKILQPCCEPLHIPEQDKPFVILVVGVNGAGKTTTIGKLAKRLQAQGHSVMLAAGDTFRAAAVEQLQAWGERNAIPVIAQHTGADSASVIFDAVQSAQAKGVDVLIADTAGRLHTKSNLMDELKKVKRIMAKLDDTAPHEVLLVLDAGTGQNALSQAKQFNEAVALTGLVLTKLDGTAKGGVIFALAGQSGIPIRYIGIGEGIDDLQDFDAEAFVNALFVRD